MNKTLFRIALVILTLGLVGGALSYTPEIAVGASPKIELYVTSWCPYCKVAEKTLKLRGLPYTLYDVEHDSEGIRRYQEMGGGGVPIFKIDGKIIRGFNVDALDAILRGASPKKTESL